MKLETAQRKVALITGASKGIGAAVASALSKRGFAIVLGVRDIASAEKVLESLRLEGAHCLAVKCDVANAVHVEAAVQATVHAFGRLDVIVNNAGQIQPIGHIHEVAAVEWTGAITTNVIGAYLVTRSALPFLMQRGGAVVNLSTGAAHTPREGWSAYCSSKAGLAMFTRCTALEYADRGVSVYGLQPGLVDSDMQGLIRASGMNEISRVPREKLAPPSYAASVVAWLADERPSDLQGQDLSVADQSLQARVAASCATEETS